MSLKKIKPNLVDDYLSKKVVNVINPPKKDYWEPTKLTIKSFYQNVIRPNWLIVVIIFIICVLLIYRYRIVQERRTDTQIDTQIDTPIEEKPKLKSNAKDELDDYAKIILEQYNKEKELSLEPKIIQKNNSGFAYPMYPYHPGGEFLPSSR